MGSGSKGPRNKQRFISARVRNDVCGQGIKMKVLSGEISYQIKMPWLQIGFTCYNTQISHQTGYTAYGR